MSDAKIVVECARYNMRWCGDGLKTNGEVCDPADPTKDDWGTGGCNTSCQPVTAPQATCDSLAVSPSSGQAPLDVEVSCTGTNATSYKIVCAPGQQIDGRTGTCKYTTMETYTPQCYINGNVTDNVKCKKTVTVTATPPAPKCSPILS
jgi:hypothetical protein